VHALDQVWEALRREFDASCAHAARAARYQLTNELNQLFRRFRHYQDEAEWISTLLDGAGRFVQQAAVFTLKNETLHLRAQTNLSLPVDLSFPLDSAAAFASAVDTHDPVVALRSTSEVTPDLASSEPSDRCHVFPIMNGPRTVAILFAADQEYMDVNALELITGVASAVLERRANVSLHAQIAPLTTPDAVAIAESPEQPSSIPEVVPPSTPPGRPAWADLSEEERALHIRAQRFSRVTVAEMQLAKPQGCRAGREQNNLYLFLKPEIEKAREIYRKQFMTIPSMVDYLHLELVNTAAEGDEMKLGAEYPGQLV
jgi:hypothetical protein